MEVTQGLGFSAHTCAQRSVAEGELRFISAHHGAMVLD